MNSQSADHNQHSDLRDALRRDAARLVAPPFDAALHHAAMRRIRALSDRGAAPYRWRLPQVLAVAVALLACIVIFARRDPPPTRPDVAAVIAATQHTIASLSMPPTASLPAWMSPTATLLNPPISPQEPRI